MLDLRDDAITAWATSKPDGAARIPAALDGDAVHAGPVGAAAARLGDLFDRMGREDAGGLITRLRETTALSEVREVLVRTGARPTLRVLAWLVDELPGGPIVAADLLDGAAGQSIGTILAESERAALLQRLYAPGRLTALEEACRVVFGVSEPA